MQENVSGKRDFYMKVHLQWLSFLYKNNQDFPFIYQSSVLVVTTNRPNYTKQNVSLKISIGANSMA